MVPVSSAWVPVILVVPYAYADAVTVQPHRISRRTVLAGAAIAPLGLLAGCSASAVLRPDPDDSVRSDVASSERTLIASYTATINAYPKLATVLGPLRDQHRDHLNAVGGSPDNPSGQSTAASNAKEAVSALAAAELAASRERVGQCVAAQGQELAWTLSLIGSSEAQHAVALAGVKA
ncbi:MAG: hypothetical protein WCI74_08645 [Actinomycetes bacterium]